MVCNQLFLRVLQMAYQEMPPCYYMLAQARVFTKNSSLIANTKLLIWLQVKAA